MKSVVLGLLTLATLGSLTVSALADEVNMQTIQQINTQEGNFNRNYQESNQSIRSNHSRNRRETTAPSYGNVQDIVQDSYQKGGRNSSRQTTIQQVEMRSRSQQ